MPYDSFGIDWGYEASKLLGPRGQYLGFRTVGFHGTPNPAPPPMLAPVGQYYVYPDGGLSNTASPGALGPFTKDEAAIKAAGMKLPLPSKPLFDAPGTTTPKTTVPNFITPYVKPTGYGAFGEKDVF